MSNPEIRSDLKVSFSLSAGINKATLLFVRDMTKLVSAPMQTRLNNEDAARYLGFAPNTMRWSRSVGKLAGVDHPRYRKIGRRVFYELSALNEWLEQFREQTNTAQG